jgi:hypothetical protein
MRKWPNRAAADDCVNGGDPNDAGKHMAKVPLLIRARPTTQSAFEPLYTILYNGGGLTEGFAVLAFLCFQ